MQIDEQTSSLSAILLDDDYYDFIVRNKSVADGLPLILQEYLIPLKSKAYLDLWQIKNAGGRMDSKDLKKHKNDVFRLYQILSGDARVALPGAIASDLSRFLDRMADDPPELKNLVIKQATIDTILKNLKTIYHL